MKASTQFKKEHKADFGHEKIEVLFEDQYLCVIYKPEGMLSCPYPGSRSKTAQDALEQIMRKKGTFSSGHKPFVVHRLDRETSGVMMFALTEAAQKKIMDTWHKMVTERLYHAVAENPEHGKFPLLPLKGSINDELAYNAYNVGFVPKKGDRPNEGASKAARKSNASSGEKSVYEKNLSVKNGKAEFKTITARTNYVILEEGKYHSLFELSLDTGRKNQIRAHLASKGYPLAGDENYRAKTDPFGRLALHARTLEFDHPFTGEHMKFEVPEPESWLDCVKNGTNAKIIPVWMDSKASKKYQNQHNKTDIYQEISSKAHNRPTNKKLRGMDFIQAGKFKSR